MKRVRVIVALAMALAACRAVLGIDPLELVEAGADGAAPAADAAIDTSASDTSIEDAQPAIDTAPPFRDASVEIAACKAQGSACKGCCRTSFGPELNSLQAYAITKGCICGAGACSGTNECGTTACAKPPTAPVPPCGPCEDQAFTSGTPQCQMAGTACAGDPSCAPGIDCQHACPPP